MSLRVLSFIATVVLGTMACTLACATLIPGPMIETSSQIYTAPQPQPELVASLRADGVQVVQTGAQLRIVLGVDRFFKKLSTTEIQPAYMNTLNKVALLLRSYCNSPVLVAGNTDNVGTDRAKFLRSKQQAETIAAYLWSQGTTLNQLRIAGLGDTHSVASNRTTDGQAANRRIEITANY